MDSIAGLSGSDWPATKATRVAACQRRSKKGPDGGVKLGHWVLEACPRSPWADTAVRENGGGKMVHVSGRFAAAAELNSATL